MSDRKADHIALTFKSQTHEKAPYHFSYEPLLSAHPQGEFDCSISFLNKKMNFPFWVSSMTGGTEKAYEINLRLAKLCAKFKLGMGLGSCRPLIDSDARMKDFDFREVIGDCPFYGNIGIAQLEELVVNNELNKLEKLVSKLKLDGLFIHVNPLQEWAQKEGDRFKFAPIKTIKKAVEATNIAFIVKEVGQGFGPQSLQALWDLNISALEFGAFGGTNFTKLEFSRQFDGKLDKSESDLIYVGHTAKEMVEFCNLLYKKTGKAKELIISGGINSPVAAHNLLLSSDCKSVVGMAQLFLKHAQKSYTELEEFFMAFLDEYRMAKAYLVKKEN